MKILREEKSQRIFALIVGPEAHNSMIIPPPDKDWEEKIIELDLNKTNGVPLNRIRISILKWLQLNEEVYNILIKSGWKPVEARQFLPKGRGG